MHKFIRAVGFSKIKNRKELKDIIHEAVQTAETRGYVSAEGDVIFAEFAKEYAGSIGLAVRGEFDEEDHFVYDYYFPYLQGSKISSVEDVTIERHAEKESYAGVCDDLKVGVSLIFYFQNVIPYLKYKRDKRIPIKGTTLTLSGLSCQGTIMMSIVKNEKDKEKVQQVSNTRNTLMDAARRGDEEAIESLTLEDMDTYTSISRKILKEDLFTLVDTYFMPYGVECDQYSVLGEIMECHKVENKLTKENVWIMSLNCNDLLFDVCINEIDLYGEPEPGRRFKGVVWMQGYINFPEE